MPDYVVVRHSLDLVLHLIDTTSGELLSGSGAFFERDGKPMQFLSKGDGHLLLIGEGRTNFRLTVRLRGYVTRSFDVDYAVLSEKMPLLEVPMLPDGTLPSVGTYVDLRGRLEGLTELDAVWLGENSCMMRDFNPRKRVMTVFNPHHRLLDRVFYALVNPEERVFEALKIEESFSDSQFLLDKKLEMQYGSNFPVARRVFGLVEEDGAYLLRLSDRGGDSRWLVRCRAGEEEWFQVIDLRSVPESPFKMPEKEQAAEEPADPAGKGGM